MNKVLIVAPFWQTPGHVGNYRVDRYIRWLNDNNYFIYVLRAGKKNEVQKKEWGTEITKKDYIFIITATLRRLANKKILKLIWYIWLTLILKFSPIDDFFLWASRILSKVNFEKYFNDLNLIISTSPPNSSHIAAYKISCKYSVPLIVDLRDGWLDEPLEQKLKKIKLLRKEESNWEKLIVEHSAKIFVTSNTWREMLMNRMTNIVENIKVLTNAYPEFKFSNELRNLDKVSLLYAGRFTGSSKKRSLDLLLNPLYQAFKKNNVEIEITFLSDLRREEIKLFENWKKNYALINISLKLYQHLPRIKMFEFINQSSGLLLLSAGYGPLPSKLFEYIKSSKPIFAVTPNGSAVSRLAEKLPQLFLYDSISDEEDYSSIQRFINACMSGNYQFNVPEEFTENYLSKIFLRELENLLE
jgi:hypothetical protein